MTNVSSDHSAVYKNQSILVEIDRKSRDNSRLIPYVNKDKFVLSVICGTRKSSSYQTGKSANLFSLNHRFAKHVMLYEYLFTGLLRIQKSKHRFQTSIKVCTGCHYNTVISVWKLAPLNSSIIASIISRHWYKYSDKRAETKRQQ